MAGSGARSCLVQILKPGNAATSGGEPNPPPETLRSVWASIIPVRGQEYELRRERQANTEYRARLDYLDGADLDETMSVAFEGKTFGITAVLIDLATRKTVDLQLSETKHGA